MNDRAYIGVRIEAVADSQLAGFLHTCFDESVVQTAVHVAALHRKTRLSRIHERTPHGAAGDDVDVDIVQDDHGIFAAEFENDWKQAHSGCLCDSLSGLNAPRKDQFVEVRVSQCGAGRAISHEDLKNVLGNACRMKERLQLE